VAEREELATALQKLAWEEARRQVLTEAASPWQPGLTQERRREAWLATLAALAAIQAETAGLAAAAEARAVEHGADPADIMRVTGAPRRRWSSLTALFRGTGRGPDLGVLSAQGRAAGSRHDLPPGA
jgi:hypothetical protein